MPSNIYDENICIYSLMMSIYYNICSIYVKTKYENCKSFIKYTEKKKKFIQWWLTDFIDFYFFASLLKQHRDPIAAHIFSNIEIYGIHRTYTDIPVLYIVYNIIYNIRSRSYIIIFIICIM